MKANKETTLFTLLTGSHLYGNATSTSDFDYKAVCVPPLDELLLNTKITNRKEKPVGVGAGDKMVSGESETEYLPIQVFLDDFFHGQTYALEVAFAVLQQEPPFANNEILTWNSNLGLSKIVEVRYMIEALVGRYLTKNVKKMVGYAISQSKMYGLKTERLMSLNTVHDMILDYFTVKLPAFDALRKTRLSDTPDLLEKLCQLDYVKMSTVMNARGGKSEAPAIEICNKKHVVTTYWSTLLDSVEATLNQYGARVKEFEGQGVDWKALSHAIRITEQVLELCSTGFLVFPRPNAAFLKEIKSGKIKLEEATEYLQNAFFKVDDAILLSKLQERTPELEKSFRTWKITVLRNFYDVR